MRLSAQVVALASILVSSILDTQVAAIDMISSGNYLVTKWYENKQGSYPNKECSGAPDVMTLTPAGASLEPCLASAVQACTQDSNANAYKKQSCTSDLVLLAQYEYPGVDVKQLQQYTDYTCRELETIVIRPVIGSESYGSECGGGSSTAYLRNTTTPKTSAPTTSAPVATSQAESKFIGVAVMAFGLAMALALV